MRTPCLRVPQPNHIALGIANELAVAADLFRREFHVFANMGIQSPFDLIAHKDDVLLRVEVTTGRLDSRAQERAAKRSLAPSAYDVLAVVFPDGVIKYAPDLGAAMRRARKHARFSPSNTPACERQRRP